MQDAEFYQLSYGVNFFKAFIKNVPSRDNCPWQVTLRALFLGS